MRCVGECHAFAKPQAMSTCQSLLPVAWYHAEPEPVAEAAVAIRDRMANDATPDLWRQLWQLASGRRRSPPAL